MSPGSSLPEIVVAIADDGSSAAITVPGGFDPAMATPEALEAIARAHGVALDDGARRVLHEVSRVYAESAGTVSREFARAVPPTPGEDARLEWQPGLDPDAPPDTPALGDEGGADFFNAVRYLRVREGDHLATISRERPGVDGRTVLGTAIEAPVPKPLRLSFDAESVQAGADGRVIALRDGVLQVRDGEVRVEDLLTIGGNVDFSTGHVDVQGSVLVRGGVKDQFRINAEKDLTVEGLVECAALRCGGTLSLVRGMAGRERGSFRAGADAYAGYLEGVHGFIGGSLHVEQNVVNCRLVVGGSLLAPRASVIGGVVAVTGSVEVECLGSESDVPTRIVLGSTPLLLSEHKHLQRRIRETERSLERPRAELEMLIANPRLSPAEKERLTELQFVVVTGEEQIDSFRERLEALQRDADGRAAVDVSIGSVIHPRVTLVSRLQTITFRTPVRGPMRIGWNDHARLVMQRGEGVHDLADLVLRSAA